MTVSKNSSETTMNMVLLVAFIALSIVSPAFSINCFQCNSYVDEGCATISPNDTKSAYFRPCVQDKSLNVSMFCRKTTQVVLEAKNFTRVIRTCGWVPFKSKSSQCSVTDIDFKLETSCQCFTDGCNLGVQVVPSVISLLVVLLSASLLLS